MSYLALAYPDVNEHDLSLIQDHRRIHDSLFFDVVGPHFSFVFAVSDIEETTFIREVTEKSTGYKKIQFVIRCATISKDGFEDIFHVFLVPDEGHSDIIKLHDVLYSGSLKEHLRLDIDYIPHIAIGSSPDRFESKRMVDEWNKRNIIIKGMISKLIIVKYEDNVVTLIKEIELG